MKEILRQHGLSLTLFGFFIVFQLGLSLVGQRQHNQEQIQHGQPVLSYFEYVTSAHYLEATMENWESEFLQMFAYVILTAFLFQKGSAESKDPDKPEAVDRDPRQARNKKDAPWPVRRGGVVLKLYENSLVVGAVSSVCHLFYFACHGRRKRVQRAGNRPWRSGGYGSPVYGNRAVLVRVFAKLAKRVFLDRSSRCAEHLPASERVAGIQAGR